MSIRCLTLSTDGMRAAVHAAAATGVAANVECQTTHGGQPAWLVCLSGDVADLDHYAAVLHLVDLGR